MRRFTLGSVTALFMALAAVPSASFADWKVRRGVDEMTGAKKVWACTRSTNVVQQQFPYGQGPTSATLCLYTDGSTKNAYVRVTQGQVLCQGDEDTFAVRVDEEGAENVYCTESNSGRTDVGYFSDDEAAHLAITSTKNLLRVQLNLYNYGQALFRFRIAGKKLPAEFFEKPK